MTLRHPKNHLILFDLDGTLLDVFEEHSTSLETVVKEVWGIPTLWPKHKRYGIPQRQTLRMVCHASDLPEKEIEAKLPRAMDRMSEVMSEILPHDLSDRCLPGAHDLLGRLDEMDDVRLVIATGTLKKTATMLLERSKLHRYFSTGAYGSECSSREELVEMARDRGLALYQLDPKHTRVATIGDAPADILAGQSINAFTISVATSLFDKQALAEFDPNVILDGLQDTSNVIQHMLEGYNND